MIEDENNMRWFLIHTHPRQEERATTNLRAWNVETFAPRLREHDNGYGIRPTGYITKPLFARYVFARFNLHSLFHKIRYTRGVRSVVSFGEGPVEVDQRIIDLIRSRIGRDGFVRIGCELEPGDEVEIRDGALRSLTGIFEREMKGTDRAVLLLNAVRYQVRVEVERRSLRKLFNHGEIFVDESI